MNLQIEDLLGVHKKLIMDPVHGGIPLLDHEVNIVDHPLFQRLRFICQNDILSLVFPGATHSRFLHSIGVMHVGSRMFMAMVENSIKQASYRNKKVLSPNTLEAVSFFHKLVRSACLLHDVGHSSFSHQFSRTETIRKELSKPYRFEQLWSGVDINSIYAEPPETIEHEHYSVRAAWQILSDCKNDQFPLPESDVLCLMETSQTKPSDVFIQHARCLWPLVSTNNTSSTAEQIPEDFPVKLQQLLSCIVSGELDADRADYMLRDGFHSSVTIGGFNLDHLLSNLHFGWCPQTNWCGIAISEKGLSSLEDFVYSRHQMYRQVYAHKTAQGFDWLLRSAIDEVMETNDIYEFVDVCLNDIHQFKHLTDSYFWEAFRKHASENKDSYSYCILERVKMKYLATRENLSDEEISHYLGFLSQEYGYHKDQLVASSITARFSKIRDNFSEMKVLVNDHELNEPTLRLISNTSHFFDKFNDERITHFYLNPVKVKNG